MIVLGYGLAILVGVLLGCLGGGGAILTVPILVYVFQVGVKQAVPMSLVIVGSTSLLGVLRHRRAGNVRFGTALTFGPMAIGGAFLGSFAAFQVSGRFQLTVFAVIMLIAAGFMLRGPVGEPAADTRRHPATVALLGAGVGFLTGFIGVGGGFLYVPALALLAGLDMRSAVGTSLALITLSCAAGLAGYFGKVDLDWRLLAGFAGLAFLGVAVGSALVPHVRQAALRRAFAWFLLGMGLFVLLRGEIQAPPDVTPAPARLGRVSEDSNSCSFAASTTTNWPRPAT